MFKSSWGNFTCLDLTHKPLPKSTRVHLWHYNYRRYNLFHLRVEGNLLGQVSQVFFFNFFHFQYPNDRVFLRAKSTNTFWNWISNFALHNFPIFHPLLITPSFSLHKLQSHHLSLSPASYQISTLRNKIIITLMHELVAVYFVSVPLVRYR